MEQFIANLKFIFAGKRGLIIAGVIVLLGLIVMLGGG